MLMSQPTPQQAADIVAIQQLAAAYAEAVSRLEIAEAVEAYAPDGILASPTTQDAVGRAAIVETISTATAAMDLIFQCVHTGLVKVDGDRARARFPITEWGRRASDGRGILFLGWYEDEVVRLPEGWRFSRRYLQPRTAGRPEFLTGKMHDPVALQPWG